MALTPGAAHVLAASAAFTRSGVIGYWRSRTPVASKNALATAAAVAPITSSPAPVEGSSRRCTTTGVTSRMLGEAQHRIRHPVEAGDAVLVECHLFLERAAHGLDHLPDDLVLDQRRIDDLAGIERAVDPLGHDVAGAPVDLDLGHRRAIRDVMGAEPDAAAGHDLGIGQRRGRDPRFPSRRFGGGIEHAEPALVADVVAAEFERVDAWP